MSDVLEINLNYREAQCGICGDWHEYAQGVPTFNGDLVSNDFPDWLHRTGGGSVPVCERCFNKHERGEIETFDDCYTHLMGGFCEGAGI